MPDQTSPGQPSPDQALPNQALPNQATPDPTPAQPPEPSYVLTTPAVKGPTINIGEEYGTAKKNLPPAKILLITIAAVVVVVLIASFLKRAKPQASGSLDNVAAVELPEQTSTMAALTFTIRNTSDKVLYVRSLQGAIKPASGGSNPDALSAMDFARYFQAFPPLSVGARPALSPETKIQPGETAERTIIVVFPVSLDVFNRRESASAIVWLYNETVPITLTK